jgi:tyrosinase
MTRLAPADVATIINSNRDEERIFASVQFAQLPPVSDLLVRVFINFPNAAGSTPIEDPHFAGTFAFFGTHVENAHHPDQPRFLVNITETLQRLRQRGELTETTPISVQLVPVPVGDGFAGPDAELILNQIEIIVTPVIVKTQ